MKGKLFVLSGPSGCGKSTVIKGVKQRLPNLWFSISATTREVRPGEVDGVHYHFMSAEKFGQMKENHEFLEYADYVDNSYGTPLKPLLEALDQGLDVLLDVEPNGALQVQARRPDAVLIFLAPPSLEILEQRLRGRGDTAPDLIEKRLAKAKWELTQADKYDYIVINDDVDTAVKEVLSVMTAGKCRTKERFELLKEEL